jgi:hypothetical protein
LNIKISIEIRVALKFSLSFKATNPIIDLDKITSGECGRVQLFE